jgi:hypothetical protein
MNTRTLISQIRKIKGLKVIKVNTLKSLDAPKYVPVQIRVPDRKFYLIVETPSELEVHINTLHKIVDTYKTRASLDRTSQTLLESFKNVYPDLTALIIFPSFKIKTILKLAAQNIVLPTGITRFTVSPRALHLNYPLHELSSGKPIEYKEEYLNEWIDERVRNKGIRFYAEQTFLLDE